MFNSPMNTNRADMLIQFLQLAPQAKVADLGCGDGAFLIRMASQATIVGSGVDRDDSLIEAANRSVSEKGMSDQIKFVCADASGYFAQADELDAVVCIGSEFIFGGYRGLLQKSRASLSESGKLLVGTVYWKQSPVPEYLALMNGENPHFDLATTVEIAHEEGYLPLGVFRSNDDEWDAFESYHAQKRYLNGVLNGQAAWIERAWMWQKGYLRWGMDTMGFCFLVLQKGGVA